MAERQIQERRLSTRSRVPVHCRSVVRTMANHHAELEDMGVRYLAVFGSVARNEAGPNSDIDILVDLERPAGLLKYAHIENYLESLLECEVDLVPYASVRPEMKDRIVREAVRVL